jgi:CRP-like cAMP-binding protein
LTLSTTDESSCELIGFPLEVVLADLAKDAKRSRLWAQYQSELCSQLFAAFVELKASLVSPVPRHKRFERGETIILEGDEGDEVFVLTKGGAQVLLQGAQVGEIHEDEVFGALAALTDSVRTATVVADQPSECMIFTRDEFRDLLRTNPNLLSKLFCDFGRAIHDLNDTVLKASHTKWRNLF